MRKKLLLMTGLCVGVLAIVAVVAQAAIVQTFTATVKPAKAKKPVALAVNEGTSLTADDPGYQVKGQPPPQKRQVIRLQKGGKFGGKYFARCKLATLQAQGPERVSVEVEDRDRRRHGFGEADPRLGQRQADAVQRREEGRQGHGLRVHAA